MPVAIIGPKFYAWDNDTGKPLAFGKVYTYEAGTNTPRPTWKNENGNAKNTNPVILNGAGYADIYLSGSYKIVVTDADDNVVWTQDPVSDASGRNSEWLPPVSVKYETPTSFSLPGNHTERFEKGRAVKYSNNDGDQYSFIVDVRYVNQRTIVHIEPCAAMLCCDGMVSLGILTKAMFGGVEVREVYRITALRGELASSGGAALIGTDQGMTLQERLNNLLTEEDVKAKIDAAIEAHNKDEKAHKALANFIVQQTDKAQAAADTALFLSEMYPDINTALSNTQPGEYFWVPDSEDEKFATLYMNTSDEGDLTLVELNFSGLEVTKVSATNAYNHQYLARFEVLVYGIAPGEPGGADVTLEARKSGGQWQAIGSKTYVSQPDGQPAFYPSQTITGTFPDAGANAEFRLVGGTIRGNQEPDITADTLRYFEGDPTEDSYEVIKTFPSAQALQQYIDAAQEEADRAKQEADNAADSASQSADHANRAEQEADRSEQEADRAKQEADRAGLYTNIALHYIEDDDVGVKVGVGLDVAVGETTDTVTLELCIAGE